MSSHRGHGARAGGVGERADHSSQGTSSGSAGNRLDFYKALSDFRGMFPSMSDDVIESVLRANDGMVEATIDQLLAMSVDSSPGDTSVTADPTGDRQLVAHMDAELLSGAGDLLELLPPPGALLAQPAASQRQPSPAGSRCAGGGATASLPATLLPSFDALDDDSHTADLAWQPPAAAAAAAAATSAVDPSWVALAAMASGSVQPPTTSSVLPLQQQRKQQFEDPFTDLFPEGSCAGGKAAATSAPPVGAWLPSKMQAADADRQQLSSQASRTAHARDLPVGAASIAGGHSPGRDVCAAAAAMESAVSAAAHGTSDSSAVASSAVARSSDFQPPVQSHLPRPPKPLGISLSLPLTSAQTATAAACLPFADATGDMSVSPPPYLPSAELGRTKDRSRQCLTLSITQPTRDLAGLAAAGGCSPQRAQLSPCSSSGGASADISPGEIVDLLERGDELPPSLPPPRRGSTRRKEHVTQQLTSAAAVGALSPQLQAAADRRLVPLIGQLPAHFLRLEEEETPPPRPPKPHSSKLGRGLHSQDDSSLLLLHAHHQDRSVHKVSRSRSQRNALIIGAMVAGREAAAAAASAAEAAAGGSDQLDAQPSSSERGKLKKLSAGQRGVSVSLATGLLEPHGGGGGGGAGAAQHPRHHRRLPGERLSTNEMKMKIAENERRLKETCDLEDLDEETVRYLEDERLALIIQNEEFLREVKRNEDFMRTLEFEQELLEARLVVDRSRRLATAQARAKTLDSLARRPPELDGDLAAAAALSAGGSASPEVRSPQREASSSSSSFDMRLSMDMMAGARGAASTRAAALADRSPPVGVTGILGGSQGGSMPGSGGSTPSQGSSGSSDQPPPTGGKADGGGGGGDSGGSAEFRRQLQGMGTSSKKKFAVLAKNFFTRKVKRSHHPHNPIGLSRTPLGPSTLNLLDDCDDEELDEDNEASTCTSPAAAPTSVASAHRAAAAPYDD